jgi:hypothetical protein
MSTVKPSAPSIDRQKLDELRTYCVDFAKQMLESFGEFHPFGATINSAGIMVTHGAWNGEERPPGQELAKILIAAFKKEFSSKVIIAAAYAANVNIPAKFQAPYPDGIRIVAEFDGYPNACVIFLPYQIKDEGADSHPAKKSVEYANFLTVETPRMIQT